MVNAPVQSVQIATFNPQLGGKGESRGDWKIVGLNLKLDAEIKEARRKIKGVRQEGFLNLT